LFGVLALGVEQRRLELGVRLAAGATRTKLLRLVLSEAAMLVGAGAVTGTVIAALGPAPRASKTHAGAAHGVSDMGHVGEADLPGLMFDGDVVTPILQLISVN
jgi:hypothetical protein